MTKSKKINITFVVHSLNPGGAERLALDMAIELKKDYNINILCLDEPGTWAERIRENKIFVHSLYREQGIDFTLPYLISRYTKRFNTHIIHAHQTTPWFYSALSRLLNPRPYLLFEEHGRFYPEVLNKKTVLFNKAVINRLTHRVVAVSEDIKNRLAIYEGIPKEKIEVIYNGIKLQGLDRDKSREEKRKGLNLRPDDFIVGSVGRLDPIKNFPMLVLAVKEAIKQIPNLKCVIVGDGPEFCKIKEIVQGHGLTKNIILTGYRKDAATLVSAFDLFILTSFSEGISMAILEAMCMGVPCIATRVGGNPELIEDKVSGWLIESNDYNALSDLICYVFNNRQLLKEISESAKIRIKDKFLFQNMIENYKKIYNELILKANIRSN